MNASRSVVLNASQRSIMLGTCTSSLYTSYCPKAPRKSAASRVMRAWSLFFWWVFLFVSVSVCD